MPRPKRRGAKNIAVAVTLIDKAPEADAGGNTRWTPSYMRMAAVDRVEPSFVHDMLEATRFQGDEDYFATLAAHAPATVQWIAAHGVPFHQPVYYLAKGPPRIQPVGGGETIHRELTRAAREAGVVFRYSAARPMRWSPTDGAVAGVRLVVRRDASGRRRDPGLRRLPGQRRDDARAFRPGRRRACRCSRRARISIPATASAWRWRSAPICPASWTACTSSRSIRAASNQAPVVLLYPYGIVVDASGRRFFDEGAGLVHETWEAFSRAPAFRRAGPHRLRDPRSAACATIPDWQRATRSEVPPVEARYARPSSPS